MFDLLKYFFNLPIAGVFDFGFKVLFLCALSRFVTNELRYSYRFLIRRKLKRWTSRKNVSGSLKTPKTEQKT